MATLWSDTFESGAAIAVNYGEILDVQTANGVGIGGSWGVQSTGAGTNPYYGSFEKSGLVPSGRTFRIAFSINAQDANLQSGGNFNLDLRRKSLGNPDGASILLATIVGGSDPHDLEIYNNAVSPSVPAFTLSNFISAGGGVFRKIELRGAISSVDVFTDLVPDGWWQLWVDDVYVSGQAGVLIGPIVSKPDNIWSAVGFSPMGHGDLVFIADSIPFPTVTDPALIASSSEQITEIYSQNPTLLAQWGPPSLTFVGSGICGTKDGLIWVSTLTPPAAQLVLTRPNGEPVSAITFSTARSFYTNAVQEDPLGTDVFVITESGSGVERWTRAGVLTTTYATSVTGMTSIYILPDGETMLYISTDDPSTIARWRLSTDSALPDLVTVSGNAPWDFTGLPDGGVILMWQGESSYATSDFNINAARFNSSGAQVQAYNNPKLQSDGYGDGFGVAVDWSNNIVWLQGARQVTEMGTTYEGVLYKFNLTTGAFISVTASIGSADDSQFPGTLATFPSVTPVMYQTDLLEYTSDGVATGQSWRVAGPSTNPVDATVNVCGISPNRQANDAAYFAFPNSPIVYRIHLSDLAITAWVTEANHRINENGILVLRNGDVLVAWADNGSGSDVGYVKRYTAAGTFVQTYDMKPAGAADPIVLASGADSTTFWVSMYDGGVSTPSGVRLSHLRLSDGALLGHIIPDDSTPGIPGTFQYDGPFCVLSDAPNSQTFVLLRVRRCALPFNMNLITIVHRVELIAQPGVGLGSIARVGSAAPGSRVGDPPAFVQAGESDPQIMVRFSIDGGRTYGPQTQMAVGKIGEYLRRTFVTRVGAGRDWYVEFASADPTFTSWIQLVVDIEAGRRN